MIFCLKLNVFYIKTHFAVSCGLTERASEFETLVAREDEPTRRRATRDGENAFLCYNKFNESFSWHVWWR